MSLVGASAPVDQPEVALRKAKQRSFHRSGPRFARVNSHPFEAPTMSVKQRTYRGVAYDANQHEQPSQTKVDHTYRGQHYEAPLRHESADADASVELHYRGNTYQHRQAEASQQANR